MRMEMDENIKVEMACRSSDERAHGWSEDFSKRINMLVGR